MDYFVVNLWGAINSRVIKSVWAAKCNLFCQCVLLLVILLFLKCWNLDLIENEREIKEETKERERKNWPKRRK